MSVTQAENGTWEVSVWYKDWQGEYKRKHEITVIPNSRTYKGLCDEMWRVYRELRRIRKAGDLSQGLGGVLIVLSKEFVGLKEELSDVEKEEAAITAMKRG